MKGRIYSLPIKIIAAMISIVACMICAVTGIVSIYMEDLGFYHQNTWNYYQTNDCARRVSDYIDEVYWTYYDYGTEYYGYDEYVGYESRLDPFNTNFRFEIYRNEEKLDCSTYDEEDFGYHETCQYYYDDEEGNSGMVTIHGYVTDPMLSNDEFKQQSDFYESTFEYRYTFPIAAIISGIVMLLSAVYLICAAGRKPGDTAVTVGGLHRIPFDILSLVVWPAGILAVCYAMEVLSYFGYGMAILGIGLIVTAVYGVGLFYIMSMAVRCKTHTLWNGMLLIRACSWLKHKLTNLYRNLPVVWKGVLVIAIYTGLTLFIGSICIAAGGMAIVLFWLYALFSSLIMLGLVIAYQMQAHKLQRGMQQMAAGDLDARVDTQWLFGEIKEQAENLNRINETVQTAVEERLKSERLKTELITNVSHDIKTPLTSIINYADLLKKQEIEDETAKEYIEVLERQSVRLKKLIEDLMEASKVSTGNIAVNLTELDAAELLKQVAGEYMDRLEERSLNLVLSVPETEVKVWADGKLLWRVFDNLLSNVRKYSQPGTRVYLDLKEDQGHVQITFRNISEYPLHISGDELTERFVRGDSSRHTEGSGLGLSIARSLTELMNGRFEIQIDGDLFKVQVVL